MNFEMTLEEKIQAMNEEKAKAEKAKADYLKYRRVSPQTSGQIAFNRDDDQ